MPLVLPLEKFFFNLGLYCKRICYKQFDTFISSAEHWLLCEWGEFKIVEIGWFPVKKNQKQGMY